ncbi:MAG: GNAT family N-acetyltransferase [Gammaproteobacteria bacterium]|nr:GNAT family N-acetyltransferase [Gammaproteobacteria bacterium]
MEVSIEKSQPTLEEFITLRAKVGWGETPNQLAKIALNNSLFHVVARSENKLVGMARIVGDGAMFFYIQDLIVDPDYQNNGIGNLLMQNIESYLSKVAFKGSTIGLLSASGKEDFYSRYGYKERNGTPLGYGMCKFV